MSESGLVKFAKGLITPESLTVTGSLTPAQSRSVISAVINNSDFLKKITTVTMTSLQEFVDAFDIAEGVLQRVAEGTEPTTFTEYSNIGCTLVGLPVQLFSSIKRSALLNNAWRPDLENFLFQGFATRFGNELVKLGCEGTADTFASGFATLCKGWIQIAKDNAAASGPIKDGTYAAGDTQTERLQALVALIDADVKGPQTSILMSWANWEAYVLEVAASTYEASVLLSGNAKTFMGYPVELVKYWPDGVYMATPLNNLVFGAHQDVYRARQFHNLKRTLDYVFDMTIDYEIIVKKWAAILTLAT